VEPRKEEEKIRMLQKIKNNRQASIKHLTFPESGSLISNKVIQQAKTADKSLLKTFADDFGKNLGSSLKQ